MKNDLNIVLNGEPKLTAKPGLLDTLQSIDVSLESKGVAVAVQDKLVRKVDWKDYVLKEGDRVEVITAAQGG